MTDYGGLGGIGGTRDLRDDPFETAVNRALGHAIRTSDESATAMRSALANVEWAHENGDTASYSFRAAGDLIAAIRGEGDYMQWYCSAPDGVVNEAIAAAMAREGWRPIT